MPPFDIEVVHPDDFILNQLEWRQLSGLTAIKRMRTRLCRPPMTAAEYLDMLERRELPMTASWLRPALDLI